MFLFGVCLSERFEYEMSHMSAHGISGYVNSLMPANEAHEFRRVQLGHFNRFFDIIYGTMKGTFALAMYSIETRSHVMPFPVYIFHTEFVAI